MAALKIKTVAGLLFIIIVSLVIAMLGYKTYEGFQEGATTKRSKKNARTARVEQANADAAKGPGSSTNKNNITTVSNLTGTDV